MKKKPKRYKRTASVKVDQPDMGTPRVIRTEVTLNEGKPNELYIEARADGSYRLIGAGHAFIMGHFSISPEMGNVIVIRATGG